MRFKEVRRGKIMTTKINAKILAIYTDSIIETMIAKPKVENIGVHTEKQYRHHKRIIPDIRAFTAKYKLELPLKEVPLIEGMENRYIIRGESSKIGYLFLNVKEEDTRTRITAPEPIKLASPIVTLPEILAPGIIEQ